MDFSRVFRVFCNVKIHSNRSLKGPLCFFHYWRMKKLQYYASTLVLWKYEWGTRFLVPIIALKDSWRIAPARTGLAQSCQKANLASDLERSLKTNFIIFLTIVRKTINSGTVIFINPIELQVSYTFWTKRMQWKKNMYLRK